MGIPLLEVQNLATYFYLGDDKKVRAVDGVDLRIDPGEVVGLVGESGCGKTVTALSIMKLVPPPGRIVHGRILWYGKDLCPYTQKEMLSIRGKQISMIFQDPFTSLNPVFTIGEQIAEVLRSGKKTRKKEAWDKAVELLELVKIPDASRRAREYPHQFSGGMCQRVMIAMAIASGPHLLIADEPTTALDATIQAQILSLLQELREKLNLAILLITHNMGVVAEICNRVAVMYGGNIVEEGPTEDLFRNPAHPYTKGLLASIPHLEGEEHLHPIPGSPPPLTELFTGCNFAPRCQHAGPYCLEKAPRLKEVAPGHRVRCSL